MPDPPRRRLRVLTWHVHGNYLYNLTQVPHDFHVVANAARGAHKTGVGGALPWGPNVVEVAEERLRDEAFDVVIYQHRAQWDDDRLRVLSDEQRRLPRIVIEHDPPREHPTDTRHWCDDPGALIVHVTHFNALMWDNGATPWRVVEHGVKPLAELPWTGELARGLVVVNHLRERGRRLGADVFEQMRNEVPLHLVGMGSEALGGAGEVAQPALPRVLASHRFFFNPIRYTSLGLAVVEALHAGLPVVGLATTELASVISNGRNGYTDTRPRYLIGVMRELLKDIRLARTWGAAGQQLARERFAIGRFVEDWQRVLAEVTA
ncbi:MAG: glycosyltransferase [Burkholderiaceae bacterium]|nr:glycosyltransferase [Burkholderiaceae bacterium]